MKTTINIAMTMLTLACTASAGAQTAVTIFGTIDANAGSYKGAATGVTANDKAVWRQEAGGMTTSFVGVRGNEDLGGGLTASFELQSFMRNDTGAAGRSDGVPGVVAADPLWSKSAWVGLSSPTLGRLRLGNISTLMFINSITSNAFGESTVFSPINLVTLIGSPLSGGTSWTNTVAYDTPTWSGLSGSLAGAFPEGSGVRNLGVRAAYVNGPLAASLAWTDVKKDPITFADGTSRNNTKALQLAASYDFKAVKVFAHLGTIKSDGSATASASDNDITHKIWGLSVAVPVGNGQLLAGAAARKGDERIGASRRTVLSVGYDHQLSKRTDVYVMLRDDETRAAGIAADATGTSYGIGIRHRF